MWSAFKNVETGVVHVVKLPEGMSPHGFAMDWPLEKTEEPLSCHLCLQFAFQRRWRDTALNAMLPSEVGEAGAPERRCGICGAPVSRCCC